MLSEALGNSMGLAGEESHHKMLEGSPETRCVYYVL